jgi:hypothetical protein
MAQRLPKNSQSADKQRPEDILAKWAVAVSAFHRNYNQLIGHVNTISLHQQLGVSTAKYIGQCPIDQLLKLLMNMEKELKKFTTQADRMTLRPTRKNFEKLLTHTESLNQLNQQAEQLLQLIALPAS